MSCMTVVTPGTMFCTRPVVGWDYRAQASSEEGKITQLQMHPYLKPQHAPYNLRRGVLHHNSPHIRFWGDMESFSLKWRWCYSISLIAVCIVTRPQIIMLIMKWTAIYGISTHETVKQIGSFAANPLIRERGGWGLKSTSDLWTTLHRQKATYLSCLWSGHRSHHTWGDPTPIIGKIQICGSHDLDRSRKIPNIHDLQDLLL